MECSNSEFECEFEYSNSNSNIAISRFSDGRSQYYDFSPFLHFKSRPPGHISTFYTASVPPSRRGHQKLSFDTSFAPIDSIPKEEFRIMPILATVFYYIRLKPNSLTINPVAVGCKIRADHAVIHFLNVLLSATCRKLW